MFAVNVRLREGHFDRKFPLEIQPLTGLLSKVEEKRMEIMRSAEPRILLCGQAAVKTKLYNGILPRQCTAILLDAEL
jgi:hypothetical protein